ncbi:MAG: HlyD family efflux transporter periplasmic adaptor subunit [Betaproteobacteria bacterium]
MNRLFIPLVAICLLAACQPKPADVYPGYAEGEFVRLAAPFAGSLTALHVRRGDQVAANAPLFALEQENERAMRAEALARLQRAQAQMSNIGSGKRPDEVAAARAQLAQAEAAQKLSAAELARTEPLVTAKFLSPTKLDEARTALERDRARVAELNSQLKVANLAGRPAELAAAAAEVRAANELLAQADWKLAQKSQRAPMAAAVVDTLYARGEWVQAGAPVVSLLPPENIKLRFYIPEKQLGALKVGQAVQVSCDGCAAPLTATVSFISPQAEYTAPLIYSKENRATLVFLVEARPRAEDAVKLHPGQPVEVKL